jgi:predicted DNA-binding protein with PD1-like motif
MMKYSIVALLLLFTQCQPPMQQEPVKTHAFRLKPGQDLRKEVEDYVKQHNIQAGWIITCVGSLTQAHLRFANQTNGTTLNGHFEIVSLAGTISSNGSHLHLSVSDSVGKTTGGHLLSGSLVYTTAEIVIGESSELIFTREKDGSTPWQELQIKKK